MKTVEWTPRDQIKQPKSATRLLLSLLVYLNPHGFHTNGWKADIQFLEDCRTLAAYYPEFLQPVLSSVLEKICELCDSLQSTVLKGAIITITDLVFYLNVRMVLKE